MINKWILSALILSITVIVALVVKIPFWCGYLIGMLSMLNAFVITHN